MPTASSDLNLLFGMLALQLDFINKDQLVSGMQTWILDKTKPIGKTLLEQGVLTADKLQVLDALMRKHLEAHGNDPHQSMESLDVRVFARDALKQIRDPDVHASLVRLNAKPARPAAPAAPAPRLEAQNRPEPANQQFNTVAPAAGKAATSRFRILRPHAKGGLGVVFVARDEEIGREVALKEIQIHLARDPDSRARFVLEAEITGGLEHPGIVPVYGLGHYADGRPYYAMRFIRGDSLKEATDRFHTADVPGRNRTERNQALRQLLRRFTDVCNAIEYAHSKGVLHRDLKPGNIMLGKFGETLVVDWGLAKAQGKSEGPGSIDLETPLTPSSIGDSSHTQMGSAIGTPAFMSPEQAAGRLDLLGPASDVYSLGATLYYVLTGQPSIMSPDLAEVLLCVQKGDFPRPREIDPRIDRALEAICLKAMAREVKDRYPSAAALKLDVDRWLDDSPVSAWKEPWTAKVRRWLNHHRSLATATVAGVLVAVISLAVATVLLTKVNEDLAKAKNDAVDSEKKAIGKEELAKKSEAAALDSERKTAEALEEVKRQKNRVDWRVYASYIALAQAAWQENNVKDAYQYLSACDPAFRGWEHRFLDAAWNKGLITLKGHTDGVECVALSADGRRIASGGGMGGTDRVVRIWDAATGRVTLAINTGHISGITSVAFSGDGQRLLSASGDGTLKVWEVASGDEIHTLKGHASRVNCAAFSADGVRIVSGSADGTVKVWDAKAGSETFTFERHKGEVRAVALSTKDERVVSSSDDKAVKVWHASTGAEIASLDGHADIVWSAAFSADGQRIVTGGSDNDIKVWNAQTGAHLATLKGHADLVASVAFSADGQRIVSGSHDTTIKIWDAKSGKAIRTYKGHTDWVTSVALSSDGQRMVSGGGADDSTVKVWDLASAGIFVSFEGHTDEVNSLAFSGDGRRIVTGSIDGTAKVWDPKTGRNVLTLKGHAGGIKCVAYSKDGQAIATGSIDRTVKVWDAKTGVTLFTLQGHADEVNSVAFSADGQRIVSGGGDKTVRVWNARTGARILTIEGHDNTIRCVAVSPDGKRIVSSCEDKTMYVWEAATGEKALELKGHKDFVWSVAYSADGHYIVSGGSDNDRTIKVWDAATGAAILTLAGHTAPVRSVAFSPDRKRIVSASDDNTVRVWEFATGQETLALKGHKNAVTAVAVSPDGQRIVSASDNAAIVWDAARE